MIENNKINNDEYVVNDFSKFFVNLGPELAAKIKIPETTAGEDGEDLGDRNLDGKEKRRQEKQDFCQLESTEVSIRADGHYMWSTTGVPIRFAIVLIIYDKSAANC